MLPQDPSGAEHELANLAKGGCHARRGQSAKSLVLAHALTIWSMELVDNSLQSVGYHGQALTHQTTIQDPQLGKVHHILELHYYMEWGLLRFVTHLLTSPLALSPRLLSRATSDNTSP